MWIRTSLKRLAMLAVLLMCCWLGLWQLWPWLTHRNQQQLADQLAAKIRVLDEKQTKVPLRQLASLGDAALPALVEAAASQRSMVAKEARQIINEQFDSWILQKQTDPQFNIEIPLGTLSEALVANTTKFGPRGKQWAENLALEIIDIADSIDPQQAIPLLKNVTEILASIPPSGPRFRNLDTARLNSSATAAQLPTSPQVAISDLAFSSESILDVPTPAPSRFEQTRNPLPEKVNTDPAKKPGNWSPEWGDTNPPPTVTSPPKKLPKQVAQSTPQPRTPPQNRAPSVVEIPSPAEMNQQIRRLKQKSSTDLIRLLPKGDLYTTGPIRSVLKERGLTDAELKQTEKFNSPQIEDRLQLIDDLSVLPAATARRWLQWLLTDESAEVRMKALSAYATTSDPKLYEVARNIAINDQDTRVANLASKIMEQAR